jgi:hypothetical protein
MEAVIDLEVDCGLQIYKGGLGLLRGNCSLFSEHLAVSRRRKGRKPFMHGYSFTFGGRQRKGVTRSLVGAVGADMSVLVRRVAMCRFILLPTYTK